MLETQLFTNYPRTQIDHWAAVPFIVKNFQKAITKDQITNHIISSIREVFSDYTPYLVWWFLMSIIRKTYGQIPDIEQPRDLDFIIDGKEDLLPSIQKLQKQFPKSFLSISSLWAYKRHPFGKQWDISVDIWSAHRKPPHIKKRNNSDLNSKYSTRYRYPNYETRWLERHKKIYKPDIYHHLSNEFSFSASLTALNLNKQTIIDLWWLEAIHKKIIIPIKELNRVNIFYGLKLQKKTQYHIIPRFGWDYFEHFMDEDVLIETRWIQFSESLAKAQREKIIQRFVKTERTWYNEPQSIWAILKDAHYQMSICPYTTIWYQNLCIQYLISKWLSEYQAFEIYKITSQMSYENYMRWVRMCI